MKPLIPLLCLFTGVGASEVARAQPLVPPPAPLAVTLAPAGLALASPWLTSGWDDGLAEVADYDLQQFRYGNLHPGSATLIAVREALDPQRLVKAVAPGPDSVPVVKLHWVRSFQTGVYRYDQSSFQQVRQADGLVLRWLITSHEWCGAASKAWVNGGPLRVSSYFDGHGDLAQPLSLGPDAVPVDSLWWWVRAWAAAGAQPQTLRLVASQIEARCVDTTPVAARISAQSGRNASGPTLEVTVVRGPLTDRLILGTDSRHTLHAWQQADGSTLTLRQVRRFAYWAHHDPADRP
jgi:hypothetical protein